MVRRAAIALDQESAIISPELVRVTAACGMLRKTVTIAKARGEILQDKTTAAWLPPFTSSICFTFKTTSLAVERAEAYCRFLERPARLSEPCVSRLRSLSGPWRPTGTAPPMVC
jgi:hypothetical protein